MTPADTPARHGRLRRWRSLPARLWRTSWADRRLLAETVVCLGVARLCVLVVPFRWTSALLGGLQDETRLEADPGPMAIAHRIGEAAVRVSRYTPWRSNCLAQALAAHAMLRRRRIASTLYLGVAKEDGARLRAHAWLRCGNHIVTGRPGHRRFTPVMSYAWQTFAGGPIDWSQ